ncbi:MULTISPECIES: C40 family peptidase [unclassified Pseudodesulfovibrio]|uniref:C40 family peptidase n=1 Tax=unclassified Pseudodesulfovibrio TaxID=2661612 RepID=UPI000FEB84D0|nr:MULTISPECIES: C40 family peptidase [unclassified Pseudodesulfovibrio]MCJ2164350.1 C40 family peptidase [Pseudodesulfovibrio sp. S3-i]RWU04560.1 peptidoglycan endopeptidase [Pseudodesulfovibrio sp. S3]
MTAHRDMSRIRPLLLSALLLACWAFLPACAAKSPAPVPPEAVVRSQPASPKATKIIRLARSMVGAPYKWGGYSPRTGFDCSGLVWFVYYQNGINLPRMASQQFGTGTPTDRSDMRPGDLVFYQVDKKGKSLHVGIVTDRGTFVHAPSSGRQVMESSLNTPYWFEHYLGTRRVF